MAVRDPRAPVMGFSQEVVALCGVLPSADTDAKPPVPWPTASLVTAAVGVIFLLYFGHEFFVPVAVAILLNS